MDKERIIKEILNHVYLKHQIPDIEENLEKVSILHELSNNGIIYETGITTTSIPAEPYSKKVIIESTGFGVNRELVEKLYGIKIPS